jgi:N-acetylglucosamine-6-phosphate deacetylase
MFSATSEADVSNPTSVVIDAGTLLTPEKKFSPGRLLIEGSTIAAVGLPGSLDIPLNAARIDASQLVVAPGFIEPHIHGCGGVDVMQGSYEALNDVSRILVRHGTTSFFPTTVSSPPDVLSAAVEHLGTSLLKSFSGAEPLGIHLEGPFISTAKRGTHKASNVLAPDLELFEKWVRLSGNRLRLITVAPELDGIDPLLRAAQQAGVTVAMGHSNATFEQAAAAADRGICYAVHTFNAMRAFSHRDPGIVGTVLSDDRIFAEIIVDGVHVDEAAVQVFARSKGKARVVLATDATSATDMPDGQYNLGGDSVQVVNGICRDQEGRLAGSTLTQEIALRNFALWTGWSFEDALLGLTLNPARALGLERKGVLEPGADADIVMLDNDLHVMKTVVAGRLVFDRA